MNYSKRSSGQSLRGSPKSRSIHAFPTEHSTWLRVKHDNWNIWNIMRKTWDPSRSKKEAPQKTESVGVKRLPSKKEGGAMNLLLVEIDCTGLVIHSVQLNSPGDLYKAFRTQHCLTRGVQSMATKQLLIRTT